VEATPEFWPLVNPNLGAGRVGELKGPSEIALVASQHFNVEIGLALADDNWVGALHW
jgi:hypothetical protein